MSTDHTSNSAVPTIKLTFLAAFLAVVVGAMVLVGWAFDIAVLKSILPGWISMKANTASCFILSGIALWLTTRQSSLSTRHSALSTLFARLCCLLVGLTGLLTLGEYIFGWNLGIDQWLFSEPVGTVNTSHPGRMTAETAADFILLSVALWLTGGLCQTHTSTRARWSLIAAVMIGLLVTILALAVILSYLIVDQGANGWFGFALMALHTAILFAMLGMAVIAINWQQQNILQWSLSKHTTVAFACGMALLVFVGLNTSRSQFWMIETNRQIAHTEKMLVDADNVLVGIIDAQVRSRDYLITGDEQFLKLYLLAKADSQAKLDELYRTEFASGEPEHQQHFTQTEAQVNAQLQLLQQIVDARRTGINEVARNNMLSHGEALLDKFRSTLEQDKSDDRQIIEQLKRESKSVAWLSFFSIFIGTLAGLLIFLAVIFRLNAAVSESKQKESSLAKSEQHFRAVAESANDAIITGAGAGNIVGWNTAAGRVFGYTEAEIIGQPLTVLIPERFRNLHSAGLARVVAGGVPHLIGKTAEVFGLHKDGSEFPLELSLAQWQTAEGQFFTAIIRDITERRRAEQALLQSEADLKTLVEHSPIAMIVDVCVDEDEKIMMMNQKFTELFGYTLEDVPDVRHWWPLAYPDEQYREALKAEWIGKVEKSIQSHGDIEPMETTVTCKDGTIRQVRISLASIGSRNIVTFEDFTERKRAEDSLLKLSLAVEQSPSSIVITDLDANIEYANAAFVKATGYSLAEAIGQNPRLLHSGKTPKASYDDLWAHLTRGEVWKGEFINRRKDGSEYIESVLISPVHQADGRVTNYLAIKEDITERKRVESDLGVHRTELEMQNEALRQAQIALEESRDQFVDLYEFSPVGYLTLGHEAMIDKINLTGATLLGVERNKLLHHRFAPFVATEDRDRWHRHFFDVLQHDGQQRCEIALRRSDNSVFHAQLDCLHVKADGVSSVRVALTDITERKEAEDARRDSEELYRTMIENSNDMIWTLSPDGKFTFINQLAADVTGRSIEDWLGKTFEPLVLAEDLPMIFEIHGKVMSGEKIHYEVRGKKADGGILTLSVNASPIFKDGKVSGTISFARDITERKRAEAELTEQLEELRGWHDITLGREMRVLDLKHEVDELLGQAGQPPRYHSAESDDTQAQET